jgi:hypothetical protein
MLPTMTDPKLPYSRALASWYHEGLMSALADDVVIRVAVHDAPMEGKPVAAFLFGVLREELGDVAVTEEILEGDKAVVLFETSIHDQKAQGLNVLHFDDSGTIRDLTVFFRRLLHLPSSARSSARAWRPNSDRRLSSCLFQREPSAWPAQCLTGLALVCATASRGSDRDGG